MSTIHILFALALGVPALGGALWLLRRQRRARRANAERDARQQRIDHLFELVDTGERDGRLDPDVVGPLRAQLEALRTESLAVEDG